MLTNSMAKHASKENNVVSEPVPYAQVNSNNGCATLDIGQLIKVSMAEVPQPVNPMFRAQSVCTGLWTLLLSFLSNVCRHGRREWHVAAILLIPLSANMTFAQEVVWFKYEDPQNFAWARSWIHNGKGKRIGASDFYDRSFPLASGPGGAVMLLPITLQTRRPYWADPKMLQIHSGGQWYNSIDWDLKREFVVVDSTELNILFIVPAINPVKIDSMRVFANGDTLGMTYISKPR